MAAQFGAIPGTHDVGAPVVPPPDALVGVVGADVVVGDPPPPTQDPEGAGALAHAHTALADASTAPMFPPPQPAITQGAAVA